MDYRELVATVVWSNCSPATKSKWRTIGHDLGQSEELLAAIASVTDVNDDCLLVVLQYWEGIAVRYPDNYNDLVAVLVKAREHRLASALKVAIQKQHTNPG